MHYLCSENKGADQLCVYRTADLRLFFAYAKSRVSHDAAHIICIHKTTTQKLSPKQTEKATLQLPHSNDQK